MGTSSLKSLVRDWAYEALIVGNLSQTFPREDRARWFLNTFRAQSLSNVASDLSKSAMLHAKQDILVTYSQKCIPYVSTRACTELLDNRGSVRLTITKGPLVWPMINDPCRYITPARIGRWYGRTFRHAMFAQTSPAMLR